MGKCREYSEGRGQHHDLGLRDSWRDSTSWSLSRRNGYLTKLTVGRAVVGMVAGTEQLVVSEDGW